MTGRSCHCNGRVASLSASRQADRALSNTAAQNERFAYSGADKMRQDSSRPGFCSRSTLAANCSALTAPKASAASRKGLTTWQCARPLSLHAHRRPDAPMRQPASARLAALALLALSGGPAPACHTGCGPPVAQPPSAAWRAAMSLAVLMVTAWGPSRQPLWAPEACPNPAAWRTPCAAPSARGNCWLHAQRDQYPQCRSAGAAPPAD